MKKNHAHWRYSQPHRPKVLRVMKLTTILLFMGIMSVSAGGFSQSLKVTLSLNNVKLSKLFKAIEEETHYRFVFSNDILPSGGMISVHAKETPVGDVLHHVLASTPLKYRFIEESGIIIISEKNTDPNYENRVVRIVKGQVTDEKGVPLTGVTVQVKGSDRATTTSTDGSFSIEVNDEDKTLIFTYVGREPQEVNIENKTSVQIVLKTSVHSLNDIVVVGYGTQVKKDLTGAITSVKLENSPLENLPNVNLLDALKGSMPGFDIGAVTGAGSNPSFNIRGQNSIRASNTPLIILDGVIFRGNFNELNPMDIARVDILKDASSTAIYGSLAANGVILLTTKSGSSNRPVIQLNASRGVQTFTNSPDMLSPAGYIQLRKDRFKADNPNGTYDINTNLAPYELDAYNSNHIIDWFKEVTRPAALQNYAVSFSGRDSRSNYYVSANYMDQQGIVVGNQFHKFSVLAKMESNITRWLKVGINLGVTDKNADGVSADFEKGTINGPYGYMYVHDRGTSNPGFENFSNQLERYPQGQTTTSNPLWNTQQYNENRNQNYRSTSFIRLDAPWVKGLTYTFNYSLNRWEGHSANFQNENFFVNTMTLSELMNPLTHLVDANGAKQNPNRTDWYLNHLINYKLTTGYHSFDVTLLAERQGLKNSSMNINAKDFSVAGTTVLGVNSLELGNPANYQLNTGLNELYQLAYMARVNYVYKSRYHASLSIRKDGYSGYAEGHKYGIFRAGAVAWTASETAFIRDNLNFVDNLKLRLSYGENGNPSVGAYSTFPTINSNTTILLGGVTSTAIYSSNLANKNLDWEKTTALNIGLDFSLFQSVLSGSFNYYNSNTTNLLLGRAIPIINGYSTVLDNIGEVNNWGIELQLNSNNYTTKNFSWSTGFNFWLNRNKIRHLYGSDADKNGIEDNDIANGLFIGKSLGASYTYVMDGIIQKNDAEYMAIYGGQPGDIKFKDLNGDGKIDATNDRTIVGYSKPNFTMTLSNTFTYRNFELYFLFNFIAGGGSANYYVGNNLYAYLPNALYGGTAANWLNKAYWTPDNPSNSVTRTNYNNSSYGYPFPKSRQFVRLQDLSFSYNLTPLLKKTPITAMKVFVSGKNLLTFSNWEGLDPETGTTFASVSGYPVFKIFTFGLNVTF